MAEVIFVVEDGTLTKYEADEYVEVVFIPDGVNGTTPRKRRTVTEI